MPLETYIAQFSKLRSDQSPSRWNAGTKHRAPHKPLLLLAVLDQFAEETFAANLIEPSPELGELFTLYWARVMPPDQRGNLALPFFHLRRDGFWQLLPRPGKESFLDAVRQISTLSDLRDTLLGAHLDEELFAFLQLQPSRDALRQVLIETYFAPEAQEALLDQGVVNHGAYDYSKTLLKQARNQLAQEGLLGGERYRPAVRDQGFRRAIISVYDHTCAFCGLRVLTADGHTAADAAHIVPWSQTGNDAVDNGMALCKLCHWGFDEGLLTASAKWAVLVSPQLHAAYNKPAHLPYLAEKSLSLPNDASFWPKQDALEWHRRNIYRPR